MKLSLVVAGFVGLFAAACADVPVEHAPPAGAAAGADPTCGATPLAAGCSNAAKGDVAKPATVESSSCKEKTCEDFEGACGLHDDGCGGTFSCGSCVKAAAACTPKTCADNAQGCGNHEDGCGGIVGCGTCATTCATDDEEPNDTDDQATFLGDFADSDGTTTKKPSLDTSDGDVDWFALNVTDGFNFTNPKIDVSVSDVHLQVAVFHQCTSLPNFSYCQGQGAQENNDADGNGCTAMGHVVLKSDCQGEDESGVAKIRVQAIVSDGTCHAYDLSVHVY